MSTVATSRAEAEIESGAPHRIAVEYLTDEDGNRLKVIISESDFELMLDDLEELWLTRAYQRAKAECAGEPGIPWEEIEREAADASICAIASS